MPVHRNFYACKTDLTFLQQKKIMEQEKWKKIVQKKKIDVNFPEWSGGGVRMGQLFFYKP